MEISDFPRLLLAAPPEQVGEIHIPGAVIAHMAYRVEDGPKLYRCASAQGIQGGILMADDLRLNVWTDNDFFCRQVVRECRARGAQGFLANWCRSPSPEMSALNRSLGEALGKAGLSLWLPERYDGCAPHAHVLISSAISGGTLKVRLQEAMERYGRDRIVLCVEPVAEDFTMPSPAGQGQPLSPEQLARLQQRIHPSVYYSSELCAHYFTYCRDNRVHFVLFDTADSIRRKLSLAGQLGIPWAAAAWADVKDCL